MDHQPAPRDRLALTWRRLRRAVLIRRRLLAAVTAALAVLAAVQAAAPPAPPTRTVLTAAHDLAAGTVIEADDLARTPLPADRVPRGTVRRLEQVLGRTTTGPVRSGEPLTDVRVVTGSLLTGYPGSVAAPVRVADPGVAALLRPGDRVDVIAADPQGTTEPVTIAARAPVIALPDAPQSTLASGALLVLAVDEATARALAGASVSSYLSVTLTR